MQEQDILLQINDIFSAILKKPNLNLTPATAAADVDGWDSLTHMMLIDHVEKHFKIKLKLMEIMKLNNIGDMVVVIKKKLS